MKKSKNKICLYGLGTLLEQNFERIVNMVGSKPDFVYDRNALFWGKRFKGSPMPKRARLQKKL